MHLLMTEFLCQNCESDDIVYTFWNCWKTLTNIVLFICRKETDKVEKAKALREASKRIQLGPESLPSICFYTLLNSGHTAICTDICDDSTLLAVGFSNSNIKVYKALMMTNIDSTDFFFID